MAIIDNDNSLGADDTFYNPNQTSSTMAMNGNEERQVNVKIDESTNEGKSN